MDLEKPKTEETSTEETSKEETPKQVTPEEHQKVVQVKEELEKKQSDLNKGIAKYRDDSQAATKQVGELTTKLQESEAALEEAKKAKKSSLDEGDRSTLDEYIEEKGLVTKVELDKVRTEQVTTSQQEVHNQSVTEFLEKHPQYNSDENWQKVQQEFGLYKQPANLQQYRAILEKVHQSLSIPDAEKRGGDKVRAEMSNKSRLSLGGGSQKALSPEEEETIENLQQKYPNLTKEQISERIKEIDSLNPKKES